MLEMKLFDEDTLFADKGGLNIKAISTGWQHFLN